MRSKGIKFLLIIGMILLVSGCGKKKVDNGEVIDPKKENITTNVVTTKKTYNDLVKNNFVSYNGALSIKNNNLINQYDEVTPLRGVSSHGIQWFSEFVNEENIKILKNYGANVFRIAMYTDEGGYLSNHDLKNKVYEMTDLLIKNDMYVIIDWHILHDNNPLTNLEEAKKFFDEVSSKYKDKANVIYEICNEPNGDTTWDDVYKYAEEVIRVIRKNSSKSIILVGTPNWSQDIDKVLDKPLDDPLVMYTLHFYSGSHKDDLRNKLKSVIGKIPVFVSEFGVTDASGSGNIDITEAKKWIDLLEENNISWVNWSLTNKDEGASFLLPNSSKIISDEYLSKSGKFIKEMLEYYAVKK